MCFGDRNTNRWKLAQTSETHCNQVELQNTQNPPNATEKTLHTKNAAAITKMLQTQEIGGKQRN